MSKQTKFCVGDRVEVHHFNSHWNGIGIVENIDSNEEFTEIGVRFDRPENKKGWFDISFVRKVPLGVTYE